MAAKSTVSPSDSPARKPRQKNAPPRQRTAVVVLGAPRSGASALAAVLAQLGCDQSADTAPAAEDTGAGVPQTGRIRRLNDAIMDSAGTDWKDWQPFPGSWSRSARAAEFHGNATGVFDDAFGTSPLFVMKDPRFCRLFGVWRTVLEEAGCQPRVVHIHRNPMEVALSLKTHHAQPVPVGLMLWLRYVLDAENFSRGLARSFVSFERLLQDWRTETERMEADLDLVLPRRSLKSADDIDACLAPLLKQKGHGRSGAMQNPAVTEWVRETHAILERWTTEGETAAGRSDLDRIRTAFDTAAPVLRALVGQLQPALTATKSLKKKLRAAKRALGAEKTAHEVALSDVKQDIEARFAQDADLSDRLSRQLEDQAAALKAAQDALAQTQSALIQRQHETEQADIRIRTLTDHIATLREERDLALARPAAEQADTLAALEQKIQTQGSDLLRYATEKKALTAQLQARYEELAQLAQLVASLEDRNTQDRETARTEAEQIRTQTAGTIKDLGQRLKAVQEAGSAERAAILDDRNIIAAENTAILTESRSLVTKLAETDGALTKARQQEGVILTENRTLVAKLAKTDKALAEMKQQQDELQKLLKAAEQTEKDRDFYKNAVVELQSSSSWRLTAPLRGLIKAIKRR